MNNSISNNLSSHRETDIRDFYHIYRLLMAVGLLVVSVYFFLSDEQILYIYLVALSALYLLFVAITLHFIHQANALSCFFISSIDALFFVVLLYFNDALGAISSNLVIITIAVSNVILPRLFGLLLAALASAPILVLFLWHWFSRNNSTSDLYSLHAAITCTLYFVAAWSAQYGTRYLQHSETFAYSRYTKNIYLQYLNSRILDSIATGILVARLNGDIVMMNQPALHLIGLSQVPQSMRMANHELFDRYQQWQQNPLLKIEPIKSHLTGLTIQVELNYLSQKEGVHVLIVLKDLSHVTEQMHTIKLHAMKRLTASIAHEIRNPLGAISHAAQLLNESCERSFSDQKLIDIVTRHVRRVNDVIESVLQLSSQQNGTPCVIDLNQWVPDFLQSGCFTEAEQQLMRLQTEPMPFRIVFDTTQLEQVIYNLINNALQHTDHNTSLPVQITISMADDNKQTALEVYNTGLPIEAGIADQLFEPFFSTRHEGSGLGLFISKQLCEINGADLQYKQCPHGACFSVYFALGSDQDTMH